MRYSRQDLTTPCLETKVEDAAWKGIPWKGVEPWPNGGQVIEKRKNGKTKSFQQIKVRRSGGGKRSKDLKELRLTFNSSEVR